MEASKSILGRMVGSTNADLDSNARLDLGAELRIERVLAERPGAITYLAHEIVRKRPVVVRVRDRKPLEAAGLLDTLEASLAEVAALRHQSIVPIYDFGLGEHTVWWTSQFVHGQSLEDLIRSEGRLPLDRTIRLAGRVADALLHAHDRGVAHGDVSPSQLLLRTSDWVVVKDFVRPENWLPTVARVETAKRSPDGDQRALSLTIYRCLIGDVDRPSAGLLAELASAASLSVRRPDLSPPVVQALVRGADPDSSHQHGSVVDLVAALSAPATPVGPPRPAAAPAVVVPDDGTAPIEQTLRVERQRRWLTGVAIAAVLLLGLGVVRWLVSARDRSETTQIAARDVPSLPNRKAPAAAVTPAPPTAATQLDTVAALSRIDTAPAAPESDSTTPPPPAPEPIVRAVSPPRPERPAPAARVAAGSARLSVSSIPGGTLYVDNRLIGATPKRLPVAPGRHVIRIIRPGYRRYLSMIELGPGEERRLTGLVLERAR
jgi:serine/threonine-protein kinase